MVHVYVLILTKSVDVSTTPIFPPVMPSKYGSLFISQTGKGAKRKGNFKRSDGSFSDSSNSFIRQVFSYYFCPMLFVKKNNMAAIAGSSVICVASRRTIHTFLPVIFHRGVINGIQMYEIAFLCL